MRNALYHAPIEIGDPLLITSLSSSTQKIEQVGYLQQRKGRALCVDVDPKFRPAKGTPIRVSRLDGSSAQPAFSSEIIGRSRLYGHMPVLLIRDQQQPAQAAFRIPAGLRTEIYWQRSDAGYSAKTALLTDLSGEGARLFARSLPDVEEVSIKIALPDGFIEASSTRRSQHTSRKFSPDAQSTQLQDTQNQALRDSFSKIECHLVESSVFRRNDLDIIHALSLSFVQPHEGCFRLVRFLERQALQRGAEATRQQAAA
ncbi:MAG: hypothetical protein ACPGRY_08260 [Candidatus Latescibacterota bacterium]